MISLRHLPLVALASIACIALPSSAIAQLKPEQAEEAKINFNKAVEANVLQVLENIELLEDQVVPIQTALIHFFAPMQMERAKMQAERQKAMEKGGQQNRGGANREAMMARMAKLEKLRSDLDKKVKAILDKKQFKKFKETMEIVVPPQRRGPGGGRPGGGGR